MIEIGKLRISKQGLIPLDYWNSLVAHVQSALVTSFVGGAFARTALGTTLWSRGGGDETTSTKPLEIILSSETTPASGETPASTTYYLSLVAGTVGGVFPKVNGSFLWQMPSDGSGGFLPRPRMEVSLSSGLLVWLKCSVAAGLITEATVETGSAIPASSDTLAYVQLGLIGMPNGTPTVVQDRFGPINYVTAYRATEAEGGSYYRHLFW